MAMEIKGQLPCPDCGSIQAVKGDVRKYMINCQECGTLTSYQSKAAKARIEKRLAAPEKPPEKQPENKPEPPKEEPQTPTPKKSVGLLQSLFDDLF